MINRLRALIKRIQLYIQITEMGPIARRCFVKNGFDGSMTMLGIIVGAWVVNATQTEIIVTSGLGACLAMGISGVSGAYMTERAERKRDLKKPRNSNDKKLDDSVITDASTFVSFYAALVDRGSHLNGAGVIITFLSRTKWATTNPKRIYLFACGNCDNVVPVGHLPWKNSKRKCSTLWNSNIDSWRSNSGIVLLLGAE